MKRTTFYSSSKNVGARFVKVSPVTLWKENRNFVLVCCEAAWILIEKSSESLCLDTSEEVKESPQETGESPSTVANEIRSWLCQNHTVSVAFFVKEIVKRSQGTVSLLLNNLPQSFPTGAGREPWESIKTFLSNPEEKAKLLDQLKASKGEHSTDFHCVELQTQQKQYLEFLPLFWTGKGKKTASTVETAESQETVPPNKRKIFHNVELASLDTVYQASNGLPTNSMIERLAESMDITKTQVIILSSQEFCITVHDHFVYSYLSALIIVHCFRCLVSIPLSLDGPFPPNGFERFLKFQHYLACIAP